MKRYRIAQSVLVFEYAIMALVPLLGVFFMLVPLERKPEGLTALLIALLMAVVSLWIWYQCLRIPVEITVYETGRVHFRSPIRQESLDVTDILSIKDPRWMFPQIVYVRHRGGTIEMISQMDDFHDLIATLKSKNPAIEVSGWMLKENNEGPRARV